MTEATRRDEILDGLNGEQQQAVLHGDSPLLIIAGAGTGKTTTLVHRVARIICEEVDPSRVLLMTFTRRASAEMLRRVDALLRKLAGSSGQRSGQLSSRQVWGGTFHAVATRLLRLYGMHVGLDPSFTIHDRGDSEDFLDVVRTDLGLAKTDKRFPKKGTCMKIYSHRVNSRLPLDQVLEAHFPWCEDYVEELKRLFQQYAERKEQSSVLDYDDLLLYLHGLLEDDEAGARIRERFDCVLVDEYQDTNRLQSEILQRIKPDGRGVTAVGDDAQSIYSFRAATVRNILDFPQQFAGAAVIKLEQNYRSTQPILRATNQVIAAAKERYAKDLWSQREAGEKPLLVTCEDDNEQAAFVVQKVLEHREAGIDLRRQAVLFRASQHSIVLEAELGRHGIPFVKYGGLKFVETAHVKDLMAFLRLAENPKDIVAASRVLMLLPGIGPKKARQLCDSLATADWDFQTWSRSKPPEACRDQWPKFVKLLTRLTAASPPDLPAQVHAVRHFYTPLLEDKYEHPEPRVRDLEQLEQLAARFTDRGTMLAEFTLDPPTTTEDFAGDPLLDEDYLILSTIHSAKGLEWDSVFVIHAADGNIPSDMATKDSDQIEEERRLFYVALTRAKSWLYVCFPMRYYQGYGGNLSDRYGYAQLTRFISKSVKKHFASQLAVTLQADAATDQVTSAEKRTRLRQNIQSMWS